ncbi:Zinc finger and BTB domain-containing protein 7C [Smittium mucronatum]|uniref:Zinc finger and BTB domain-containing protein 7C n=1 Tax=Smittium mucronatum TaxID=133383 RepID=A0A1R0H5H9_9FUNG|nr:Zinc finger and BTB domain-containing protein 7C [Smittium mucronatum]
MNLSRDAYKFTYPIEGEPQFYYPTDGLSGPHQGQFLELCGPNLSSIKENQSLGFKDGYSKTGNMGQGVTRRNISRGGRVTKESGGSIDSTSSAETLPLGGSNISQENGNSLKKSGNRQNMNAFDSFDFSLNNPINNQSLGGNFDQNLHLSLKNAFGNSGPVGSHFMDNSMIFNTNPNLIEPNVNNMRYGPDTGPPIRVIGPNLINPNIDHSGIGNNGIQSNPTDYKTVFSGDENNVECQSSREYGIMTNESALGNGGPLLHSGLPRNMDNNNFANSVGEFSSSGLSGNGFNNSFSNLNFNSSPLNNSQSLINMGFDNYTPKSQGTLDIMKNMFNETDYMGAVNTKDFTMLNNEFFSNSNLLNYQFNGDENSKMANSVNFPMLDTKGTKRSSTIKRKLSMNFMDKNEISNNITPSGLSVGYSEYNIPNFPCFATSQFDSNSIYVDGSSLGQSGGELRPYKCSTCSQSFSRNHDLKRHVKIHTGVKPYKCKKCGKKFGRSDALKRHSLVKKCRMSDQSKSSPIKQGKNADNSVGDLVSGFGQGENSLKTNIQVIGNNNKLVSVDQKNSNQSESPININTNSKKFIDVSEAVGRKGNGIIQSDARHVNEGGVLNDSNFSNSNYEDDPLFSAQSIHLLLSNIGNKNAQ